MTATFISSPVWPTITKALRSRRPARVAVAYLGKGASRLLPVTPNSVVVVDASEHAVSSGQTCPDELRVLLRRGVRIFSAENLHAKVFVVGGVAYIGSSNASGHSERVLIEAVLAIRDRAAVAAARRFVDDCALYELGEERLKDLARIYKPPRLPGGKPRRTSKRRRDIGLPAMRVLQLVLADWSEDDTIAIDSGMTAARKKMERPRRHELIPIPWHGACPAEPGQVVVMVTKHSAKKFTVSPPGMVVSTHHRHASKTTFTALYVETPRQRELPMDKAIQSIGPDAKKRLKRAGRTTPDFARRVFAAFHQEPRT